MNLSKKRIKEICRKGQGAAACRYLSRVGDGFRCEKFSAIRRFADRSAERGLIAAKGDNCPGIRD